jgi:antitoxin MazE
MKANIISIGNSQGIRIHKNILQQCNIEKEVNLEIKKDKIIIKPIIKKVRKNWDLKFKEMNKNKEDVLLIDDTIDLSLEDWQE